MQHSLNIYWKYLSTGTVNRCHTSHHTKYILRTNCTLMLSIKYNFEPAPYPLCYRLWQAGLRHKDISTSTPSPSQISLTAQGTPPQTHLIISSISLKLHQQCLTSTCISLIANARSVDWWFSELSLVRKPWIPLHTIICGATISTLVFFRMFCHTGFLCYQGQATSLILDHFDVFISNKYIHFHLNKVMKTI